MEGLNHLITIKDMKEYLNKNSWYSIGFLVIQPILAKFGIGLILAHAFGVSTAEAIFGVLELISIYFAVRSFHGKAATVAVIVIFLNIVLAVAYYLAAHLLFI